MQKLFIYKCYISKYDGFSKNIDQAWCSLAAKDLDDMKDSPPRIINKTNSPINISLKTSPLSSPLNSPERPNSPVSPAARTAPSCPTPASSPIAAPINNAIQGKRVRYECFCRHA